jgi:hypothetical protein
MAGTPHMLVIATLLLFPGRFATGAAGPFLGDWR